MFSSSRGRWQTRNTCQNKTLFKDATQIFNGQVNAICTTEKSEAIAPIEIVGLEGERTNEKWTIFLEYQGKLIMLLPSAARLGCLLLKIFF
jgi:hypothetical protein